MGQETEKNCRLLAESIWGILQKGFTLSDDALHFIDSTYHDPSVEELERMLMEQADGEGEILYSLIFYPDEDMQVQLEELLETLEFKKQDEQRVLEHLMGSLLKVAIFFPDNRPTLHVTLPESVAARFISRLNISKKLDRRLIEQIDQNVPESQAFHVKVKLRNARFNETESRISFLCNFFKKMKDLDAACLEFLLRLFEETQEDDDIYETLQNRKQLYFKSIQRAKRYREMLKTHNVETLMLRGIRIPNLDMKEAQEKMEMIDRISHAVYGKSEYFPDSPDVVETSRFGSED
ncbi:MAG: hypothetical protein JRH18_12060 [Deltaproteobacteria bacterium]|nr:hypothetical protein [Deltaproteobacteria bacterium]MBW2152393.1 hypothetical protein [Deltaproteobacteria bacterium]